jgi:hypothetical protein
MSIKKQINALVAEDGKWRQLLPTKVSREPIPAKLGVAKQSSNPTAVNSNIRTESITVYSHLIITEDGAFERPHGWPANGSYPAGTPVPSPLPKSLINSGGVLSLDVDAQYYEQKRVHIVCFDVSGSLYEDRYLIPLAAPFSGYYQGIARHASGVWFPSMHLISAADLAKPLAARMSALLKSGVVNDN